MYTLYIGNKNYSSWSLRPWLLMSALGIPFEERLMPFPGGDSHAYFRPVSPSGRVPCLHDGESRVWDSLAIAEYLAERHPGVWPADAAARAWARSAAAEMHSSFSDLRNICGMNCGIRVSLHGNPPALQRDVGRVRELWEEGLSRFGGPWLAGESLTAVDAFFGPVAFRAQTYGLDFGPAGNAYVGRLLDHPAMRSWYEAALAETFREAGHEAGIESFGTIVEDRRATA